MTQKQSKTLTVARTAGSTSTVPGSTTRGARNHSTRSSRAPDAIALLTEDHQSVQNLFKEFEALADVADGSKRELVDEICIALTIHAAIEEEIFYPAAREAIDDDDLMDEADVEHHAARNLIAQIQDMSPDESHYDAKVKVLGEEVEHHVKEEQEKMFPKIEKSDLDLSVLGEEMIARKAELQQEMDEDQ